MALGGDFFAQYVLCMYVAYLKSSIGLLHMAGLQGHAETFCP